MRALDRNGYAPSIIDFGEGVCYCCRRGGDLARHEIYGNSSRQISKRTGLWINVCSECHARIHLKSDDGEWDRHLKKTGYQEFCKTHSKEEFYELFGRYYEW